MPIAKPMESPRLEESFPPFVYVHSKERRLGQQEGGRSHGGAPFLLLTPPHFSCRSCCNEKEDIRAEAQQPSRAEQEQPHLPVDVALRSAAPVQTDGERGGLCHRPLSLLTTEAKQKITSSLPPMCSLPPEESDRVQLGEQRKAGGCPQRRPWCRGNGVGGPLFANGLCSKV